VCVVERERERWRERDGERERERECMGFNRVHLVDDEIFFIQCPFKT
jgi:hypothetical protein